MTLKPYPAIPPSDFENSETVQGIWVAAKPLLNEEELEDYFGVNLLKKGILPIYLTIRNDNTQDSFIFQAESVRIKTQQNSGMYDNPEKDMQEAGKGIAWAGAILISPPLLLIAIHQLSNASIIEENFESKKIRTKTLDPGQQTSGFVYFNFDELKSVKKTNLYFKVFAPLSEASLLVCISINLQE